MKNTKDPYSSLIPKSLKFNFIVSKGSRLNSSSFILLPILEYKNTLTKSLCLISGNICEEIFDK